MQEWIDPQPISVSDALREAAGGHPLVAEALARRGIATPAAARAFLDPECYRPAPAAELPDMERATERIWLALARGERILVWGDFDVDGQTATALLVETLRALAPRTRGGDSPPPWYRVPLRGQGHGIHLPTLDGLLDQGAGLLITCDTGVDAFAAVERARARGCDVVVTDHHQPPEELPPALAVVNPRRLPADHPLRELPGAGVAYKLAEQLFERAGRSGEAEGGLDLAALGIVGDLAVQVADVRYLLQRGLAALRATERAGLRALVEQAELRLEGLTEEHVGYQIAPRLNVLGRLGDAHQGVELLLTEDVQRARILAAELEGLNYQRRLITNQVFQAALGQIERDPALLDPRALVLAGHNWHVGILGLVAGRLAERFRRPAVVLSLAPDGPARGSARSVPGCDITAAIAQTAHLLLRFGGHPGAAGVTLEPAQIEPFRKALSRAVAGAWDPGAAAAALTVDAYVALDELSLELVAELERLAPFGPGNPPVKLATRGVQVVQDALVGRNGEHRRLVVADESGARQTVLWWQGADQPLPDGPFDLAYSVRSRDFRGQPELEVEWIAARPRRPAEPATAVPTRQVVDWRNARDARAALAGLPPGRAAVWAEGETAAAMEAIGGRDRRRLHPAPALVIWTAPAGPVELAEALAAVEPERVYLVGAEPATGGLRGFAERLMGLVKHDLEARSGEVDLDRLAAALAHRKATVRLGLEWLAATGKVDLVRQSEERATLRRGGTPSGEAAAVEGRLRRLLEETSAYRRHFRSAPAEALGVDRHQGR
jgi:single-stranded-DNA-specific exonuclease